MKGYIAAQACGHKIKYILRLELIRKHCCVTTDNYYFGIIFTTRRIYFHEKKYLCS